MPSCIEWGEERHQECTLTRDEGYRSCSSWGWFSWLCIAWTWVSNVVCVVWTWVTTSFCVVWDIITTIINAILVTLESILGWLLSAIAFIFELLECIPVLGTFIRWIYNGLSFIAMTIASLPDALLGAAGVRPEKILRVCTVILRDEHGIPIASVDYAKTILQLAVDVYKRDANVRIVPLKAFKYSTGFSGAETVDNSWVITDSAVSDSSVLDVPCGASGVGDEWLLTGSKFQSKSGSHCLYGRWRNVTGYGAPVTCFIIRSIPGNSGCSLWITDYVTIVGENIVPPSNKRVLGHEVGHSCNLWHICVDEDRRNLMAIPRESDSCSNTEPDRANPSMTNWQAIRVRASKHVTYF